MFSRRKFLMATCSFALLSGGFRGGLGITTGLTSFVTLKIGAGGQLRGLDIAPDGTKVVKTDVGGGYIWNGSQWVQLITSLTMPAAFVSVPTDTQSNWQGGCWEVRIAPSLTSRLYYINNNGYTFRSNNSGVNWILTGFPQDTGASANVNGTFAFTNQKMAVDPANPDIIYEGSISNGTQVSFDGGVTAATVSAITNDGSGPGAGICFDSSGGTVVVSGQTRTAIIYVPSYNNGVWQSTDGGVTWTQIATGSGGASPLKVWNGKIGSDGAYFCSDSKVGIWRWQASTWTLIVTTNASQSNFWCIVPDPNIPKRLIYSSQSGGGQSGNETLDYTATPIVLVGADWNFNSPGNNGVNATPSDIPWLATSDVSFKTSGDMLIDPSIPKTFTITGNIANGGTSVTNVSSLVGVVAGQYITGPGVQGINKVTTFSGTTINFSGPASGGAATGGIFSIGVPNIFYAEGIGAWKMCWPLVHKQFEFVSQSIGIEELVSNDIVAPANGLPPVLASWDRAAFQPIAGNASYPSGYGPTNGAFGGGWAVDYAANNSNVIVVAAGNNTNGSDQSAISSDGGVTWTAFTGTLSGISGNIAAQSATNLVRIAGTNGGIFSSQDGGVTWTACAGLPTSGWGISTNGNAHILCTDKPGGTYYAYFYNATAAKLFSSADGVTWNTVYGPTTALTTFGIANQRLRAAPGNAGHLWYTGGSSFHNGSPPPHGVFKRSTDGGVTWVSFDGTGGRPIVSEVFDFGFGATAPGASYPTLFIVGWVSGTYGVWRSTDQGINWTLLTTWPINNMDLIKTVNGDMNIYGTCYIGFSGNGYAIGTLH